jgi:hypothetical protein
VDLLQGRGWFTARLVADAVYLGCDLVHSQQFGRVRALLDEYVELDLLQQSCGANCVLYRNRGYRFTTCTLDALRCYWLDAMRGWSDEREADVQQIEDTFNSRLLDVLTPAYYAADGKLLIPLTAVKRSLGRPSGHAYRDRLSYTDELLDAVRHYYRGR